MLAYIVPSYADTLNVDVFYYTIDFCSHFFKVTRLSIPNSLLRKSLSAGKILNSKLLIQVFPYANVFMKVWTLSLATNTVSDFPCGEKLTLSIAAQEKLKPANTWDWITIVCVAIFPTQLVSHEKNS